MDSTSKISLQFISTFHPFFELNLLLTEVHPIKDLWIVLSLVQRYVFITLPLNHNITILNDNYFPSTLWRHFFFNLFHFADENSSFSLIFVSFKIICLLFLIVRIFSLVILQFYYSVCMFLCFFFFFFFICLSLHSSNCGSSISEYMYSFNSGKLPVIIFSGFFLTILSPFRVTTWKFWTFFLSYLLISYFFISLWYFLDDFPCSIFQFTNPCHLRISAI